MIEQLKKWLSSPLRKYTQGVTLFEKLASEEIRKKYMEYFKSVENPVSYDPHFTMLVNKLSDIDRKIKLNPNIIRITSETPPVTPVSKTDKPQSIIPENLPSELLTKYNRIQEITPLMARIHSELSETGISDEIRKEKATELCDLDDEKTELWKTIDDWSGKNGVTLQTQPQQNQTSGSVAEGAKILKRIEQIKENISRSENAEKKAKDEGKKNLETNAKNRLVKYRKELSELETKLKTDDK